CAKRRPIRICLLNATPCSILASSLRMSDAGVVRLLLFRVGGLVCAAEAERVREILPRLEPTRIPGAPPVVAGGAGARGGGVAGAGATRAVRRRWGGGVRDYRAPGGGWGEEGPRLHGRR